MTDMDFNKQLIENAAKRKDTSLPIFTPKPNPFKLISMLTDRVEVLEKENKDLIESHNDIVAIIKNLKPGGKTAVSKNKEDEKPKVSAPKDKKSSDQDNKVKDKVESEGSESIKKE